MEPKELSIVSSFNRPVTLDDIPTSLHAHINLLKNQNLVYAACIESLVIYWVPHVKEYNINGSTLTEEEQAQQSTINGLKEKIQAIDNNLAPHLQKERALKEKANKKITRLHEYNDIKDIAQALIGKLAEFEGVRTVDLYKNFGLDIND